MIYDGGSRCPGVVYNEKVTCGLGRGLAETGHLDPEGRDRAIAALTRFAALAQLQGVGALAGVATAAVREASDGAAFRDQVEAETNIRLTIASGMDEARLAGQGVLFGDPAAEGVVADLGGASMEFCRLGGGATGRGVSTLLGPLSLPGDTDDLKPSRRQIARVLTPLAPDFGLDGGRLYLVGGAWRALARVSMARRDYSMRVVHEYTMVPEEALETARWVQTAEADVLQKTGRVSSSRLTHMPKTGALLEAMVEHLTPGDIAVSAFGLREGVCYEYLPAALRDLDPLLATCARQERHRARWPGFGVELHRWLSGVLPGDIDPRLVEAACLLSDVCWRAHPEYRENSCLEAVTRPNLSSVGHAGRAFLGAALVGRYRRGPAPAEMRALLLPVEAERAGQLGALMRLGCTVSGATPGLLAEAPMSVDDGKLTLRLGARARMLAGEVVNKRLGQAARALGLDADPIDL